MTLETKKQSLPKSEANDISVHEQICAIRYENIEARLDSGQARFIRIEAQIWGLYALMIGSTVLAHTLGG